MRYCSRCIIPDTRPNIVLGPDGVCNACSSFGDRPQIDWKARAEAFREVVRNAKSRGARYDCVIPVSGGKDSTWQVVRCLEHGLHPLAVTWRPPVRTAIGEANLRNLVSLGVDHIEVTVNPRAERVFLRKALERFGAAGVPMHMALFSIPLDVAYRYEIPLVVWGENTATEYGGSEEERRGFRMDDVWIARFGVTHGTTARDWVDDDLSAADLAAYFGPSGEQLAARGVLAVFLGHYFSWDPQETYRVAKEHGFRARAEGAITGLYDYADIDDPFIAIHHYFKWYKFGFTRLFDNLSLEIRNGRMTREEAVDVIRRRGDETPHAAIQAFCEYVGFTTETFFAIAERFRNPEVWKKVGGAWTIPDFLIPEWSWKTEAIK